MSPSTLRPRRTLRRTLVSLIAAVVAGAAILLGVGSAPAHAALTTTQIQQNLAGMYYYPYSAIDGQYGSQTTAAVKAFQADACTTQDGVVGPVTEERMRTQVKKIQAVVGATQDGWFGSTTRNLVINWQRAHGLTADGAAGPSTMAAMGISRVMCGSTAKTGTLTFDKNWTTPSDSRLILTIKQGTTTVVSRSWRAGSGKGSTNDCANNLGWLPNGGYDMELFTNYQGNDITGYALRLSKGGSYRVPCYSGSDPDSTPYREQLFIHRDYSGQYTTSGCIAVAYDHVKALHDYIRSYFGTSGSGGRVPFKLNVVS